MNLMLNIELVNIPSILLLLLFLRILGESNRVPFDISEPEPESVAGSIIEYSS